jgi:hypothetical protein
MSMDPAVSTTHTADGVTLYLELLSQLMHTSNRSISDMKCKICCNYEYNSYPPPISYPKFKVGIQYNKIFPGDLLLQILANDQRFEDLLCLHHLSLWEMTKCC